MSHVTDARAGAKEAGKRKRKRTMNVAVMRMEGHLRKTGKRKRHQDAEDAGNVNALAAYHRDNTHDRRKKKETTMGHTVVSLRISQKRMKTHAPRAAESEKKHLAEL